MVVMMLGYCLHGPCALPTMVINTKIVRESATSQKTKARGLSLSGTSMFPDFSHDVGEWVDTAKR